LLITGFFLVDELIGNLLFVRRFSSLYDEAELCMHIASYLFLAWSPLFQPFIGVIQLHNSILCIIIK